MNKKTYILAIDTTQPETGIGLLIGDKKIIKTWLSERNQSDELLPNIDKLFKKEGIKPAQLNWVAVNLGPGSFTGLRIGVSVANAFGYGLDIPVMGKAKLIGDTKTRVEQLLNLKVTPRPHAVPAYRQAGGAPVRSGNKNKFKQVLPEYGRPPRITKPKK